MRREPAVSGSFYPASEKELRKLLGSYLLKAKKFRQSNAVIAPHAGYVYSGKTAAFSFKNLKDAETYVLLGPNHTGLGRDISVYPEGVWETPLGEVQVNKKIASFLDKKVGKAELDEMAHLQEHSLEVQLPFLQATNKKPFQIVPVTIRTESLEDLKELGKALKRVEETYKSVSFIASSDFSHFLPLENAKEKDMDAIKSIAELDVEGFEGKVREKNLSICGHSAITALMQYCREKGLREGRLLKYETSAAASGEEMRVVGYASILFG